MTKKNQKIYKDTMKELKAINNMSDKEVAYRGYESKEAYKEVLLKAASTLK